MIRLFGRATKRVSAPGKPPNIHDSKSPLKTLTLYNLDRKNLDVSVGPALFKSTKSGQPLPYWLEHGGTLTVRRNTKSGKRRKTRRVRYRARPYVGEAFRRTAPKLAEFIKA